ncbi:hypothetical protein NEOLEDRAFT_935747 [Neolentinus lepideus HHB14362 ss-1]|uniref:BTB domain-containing protein n=1 Tax=Neolentinus lepideus HHB14362 ss-1 TaxID=1314782 RepID=A0A165NIK6_9AGAM|nr:hypothetical protein NEOLEDRAFT_935747 [Neolentinus lepideus HHB14362 ss-1]
MRDVASKTLNALVYYLYTGDIEFATLRSVKAAPAGTPAGTSAEAEDTEISATAEGPDSVPAIQLEPAFELIEPRDPHGPPDWLVFGTGFFENPAEPVSSDELYSCSPKSMYRFADMLELDELRQRAFEAIMSNLSKENIIEEVFSKFTSRYPEVLEMEIRLLNTMRNEKEVQDALAAIIQRMVAGGEFSHAGDALSKFVLIMAGSRQ